MKDWRQRLDARIDRCPGCDQWRWDHACQQCDQPEKVPTIVEGEAA